MKFTKETLRRALRTFLQSFFGSIVVTIPLIDTTDQDTIIKSVIFVVVAPALSAGLAAIMNAEKTTNEE